MGNVVPCNATIAANLDTNDSTELMVEPGGQLWFSFGNVPKYSICAVRLQFEVKVVTGLAASKPFLTP